MEVTVKKEGQTILTPKEVELAQFLAEGKRAADIGIAWDKSRRTIETQIDKLKTKTGAKTIAHLMSILYKQKILK